MSAIYFTSATWRIWWIRGFIAELPYSTSGIVELDAGAARLSGLLPEIEPNWHQPRFQVFLRAVHVRLGLCVTVPVLLKLHKVVTESWNGPVFNSFNLSVSLAWYSDATKSYNAGSALLVRKPLHVDFGLLSIRNSGGLP